MKRTLATLGALVVLVTAPLASADTVRVKHADLDLRTAHGQGTLNARVEEAIREVCQLTPRITGDRLTDPEAVSCYKLAKWKSAVQIKQAIASAVRGG